MHGLIVVATHLLLTAATAGMQPRVLLDAWPLDSVVIADGRVLVDKVDADWPAGAGPVFDVSWDGVSARITGEDRKASAAWKAAHTALPRISVTGGDILWDGKRVDLGRVKVEHVFEAIAWRGGVLCRARTFPRKGFFERWPFKGPFMDPRDIEPFSAIFFDPTSLRGEDRYLNGKVSRAFLIFPLPDMPQ